MTRRPLRRTLPTLGALLLGATALSVPSAQAFPDAFDVDTTEDTVDADVGDGSCEDAAGDCSLRAAIMEANALGTPFDVNLDGEEAYELTLVGSGEDGAATGDLDVTGAVKLNGNGALVVGQDAFFLASPQEARQALASPSQGARAQQAAQQDSQVDEDRLLDVQPGATLLVNATFLAGGSVGDASGGAIRSNGDLTLNNSVVAFSSARGDGGSGGGIFAESGSLTVNGEGLAFNAANRAGGAIEIGTASPVRLTGTQLTSNFTGAGFFGEGSGPGNGGGLHVTGAGVTTTLRNVVVDDNFAESEGGGLWNQAGSSMEVIGGRVQRNVAFGFAADEGGGGIFNNGGTLTVGATLIGRNEAIDGSGSGGGIFSTGGEVTLVGTRLNRNRAARAGGGIELVDGELQMTGGQFFANRVGEADGPGNGGGVHVSGTNGTFTSFDGTGFFANVAASEGGGLWNAAGGIMQISNSRVVNNTANGSAADNGGGGIFNDGGEVVIFGGNVTNNRALEGSASGGGILNDEGGLVQVSNATVGRNRAKRAGGGIEARPGSITKVLDSTVRANRVGGAPGNGGGLHLTGAGLVIVRDSQVLDNHADNEGGGVWCSSDGDVEITDTTFVGNTAPVGPDVFFALPGSGTCTMDGNPLPPGA